MSLVRWQTWRVSLIGLCLVCGISSLETSTHVVVGTWKLQVEWPNGRASVVLDVIGKDDGLTATWTGPQGQLAADAVTFDDGLLRFTLPVQDQTGNPVPLQFEGRVVGGKMEGHLSTPGGGRIAVTGERGD